MVLVEAWYCLSSYQPVRVPSGDTSHEMSTCTRPTLVERCTSVWEKTMTLLVCWSRAVNAREIGLLSWKIDKPSSGWRTFFNNKEEWTNCVNWSTSSLCWWRSAPVIYINGRSVGPWRPLGNFFPLQSISDQMVPAYKKSQFNFTPNLKLLWTYSQSFVNDDDVWSISRAQSSTSLQQRQSK